MSVKAKTLVWDLPLRLFHWLLVVGIVAAWFTSEQGFEDAHMKIGYGIIGLLIFRVFWGFLGTQYSRFSHFGLSPCALVTNVRSLFRRDSKPAVGHNPLGALSAILLLCLVSIQAATGLFTKGEIWYGPYTSAVGDALASRLDGIHHANFDYVIAAAGLHVFAIFFYLFYKKQNLLMPMITGKKASSVAGDRGVLNSRLFVAGILLLLVSAFVYWLIFIAPPPVVYDDY